MMLAVLSDDGQPSPNIQKENFYLYLLNYFIFYGLLLFYVINWKECARKW
jgi:hypothetical protein